MVEAQQAPTGKAKRKPPEPRPIFLVYKVNEDGELDKDLTELTKSTDKIVELAQSNPDGLKVVKLTVPTTR